MEPTTPPTESTGGRLSDVELGELARLLHLEEHGTGLDGEEAERMAYLADRAMRAGQEAPPLPEDLTPDEAVTPLTLDELRAALAEAEGVLLERPGDGEATRRVQHFSQRIEAAIDAEAKIAVQPTPPPEVDATATGEEGTITLDAGGTHPHLLAKGYTAARAELVGSASRIQAAGMATIDEAIGYAEESLGKAQVKDAPRQVVEGIGDELRILRACRHLCQELNKIAEGQAARQRILGGQ